MWEKLLEARKRSIWEIWGNSARHSHPARNSAWHSPGEGNSACVTCQSENLILQRESGRGLQRISPSWWGMITLDRILLRSPAHMSPKWKIQCKRVRLFPGNCVPEQRPRRFIGIQNYSSLNKGQSPYLTSNQRLLHMQGRRKRRPTRGKVVEWKPTQNWHRY